MNRYGPKAQKVIQKTMHQYKAHQLTSGSSHQPVEDRQQALAIGIEKARKRHYKVPPRQEAQKGSR